MYDSHSLDPITASVDKSSVVVESSSRIQHFLEPSSRLASNGACRIGEERTNQAERRERDCVTRNRAQRRLSSTPFR